MLGEGQRLRASVESMGPKMAARVARSLADRMDALRERAEPVFGRSGGMALYLRRLARPPGLLRLRIRRRSQDAWRGHGGAVVWRSCDNPNAHVHALVSEGAWPDDDVVQPCSDIGHFPQEPILPQAWDAPEVSDPVSPEDAQDPWLDAWPDADPTWDD
jgi:hypothetical protein